MKSIFNFITEGANELYMNSSYWAEPDIWMVGEEDESGKYYIHFFSTKKEAIKNLSYATDKDKAETIAAKVNKTGDYEQKIIGLTNYVFAKIL